MLEHYLWVEKYRPRTVEETILPKDLKTIFQKFVDTKNVPNLLLAGPPGCGKTTVAKAMLDELGCDYIIINGSLKGGIDTLRNDIMQFASSVSFSGGRKYVILDEADYLNASSTQPALRNFMEEFSRNCGFILTCNYPNRVIKELHSRCSVVNFKIPKKEFATLAAQMVRRITNILEMEEVKYDTNVLVEVIKKYFPDWRRTIGELQKYAATGAIDSGILSMMDEISIKQLMSYLKEKNFTEMRKWVAENADADSTSLFRSIYVESSKYIKLNTLPLLVVLLAKYQYQAAFVADHEINIAACLTEMMIDCEFL